MSSLSQQLQKIASLDASRLTSRGGHPSNKSYLFPPTEAASHDLDAIYALALSGFEEIISLDPTFEDYQDELFSEKAKVTDRMMLNAAENKELNVVLERCLRKLGKWVGIMAGGKCIEWLVRRFRVHEMNGEALLQVFLPYHSSPNFARILAILTLPVESPYHVPFAPLIKQAQPVPRSYITTVIAPEREKSLRLLSDIAGMVQAALIENTVHRALLAFWTGVMVELLEKSRHGKGVGEGLVKVLVETFVGILTTNKSGKDVNAAVYPPLILLTRSVVLADEPFSEILSALLAPNSGADTSQRILTLLVVLNDRKDWQGGLGDDGAVRLSQYKELSGLLTASMEKYDFTQALSVVFNVMAERPDIHERNIAKVIESSDLSSRLVHVIATRTLIVGSSSSASPESKKACQALLNALRERHPTVVDTAALTVPDLDSTLVARPDGETAMLNALSADVTARVSGIEAIMSPHLGDNVSGEAAENLRSTILARLGDMDVPVLDALYKTTQHRELVAQVCSGEEVIKALRPAFTAAKLNDEVIKQHLAFVCQGDFPGVFEQLLFSIVMPTQHRVLSEEAWKIIRSSSLARNDNVVKAITASDVSSASDVASRIAAAKSEQIIDFSISQLGSQTTSNRLLAHLVMIHILDNSSAASTPVAVKILAQLRPVLSGPALHDFEDVENPLSAKLLTAISAKPSASRTVQRATVALFAAIAKTTQSNKGDATWLSHEQSDFKAFVGEVYTWANSDILPPALAKGLLRSLFMQLGEETLLFLASVWTQRSASLVIRTAALKHAGAFVAAHKGQTDGTDFQLVLPSLLIAFSDTEKKIREAGISVVKAISAVNTGSENVYALDSVYGSKSTTVRLLKQADMASYLRFLLLTADKISLDPMQVRIGHTEKLSSKQGEGKKDISQRRAIIAALLSHVAALQSMDSRLALLQIFSGIDDTALFRGVLPLLLAAQQDENAWLRSIPTMERNVYTDILFGALTPKTVGVLQEEEGRGWKFLRSLLAATDNDLLSRMRTASLDRMQKGVFDVLAHILKTEYIEDLLRSLDKLSTDEIFATKAVLATLTLDPATLIAVSETISASLDTTPATLRKRQKQDDSNDVEKAETSISQLTTLLDSRDFTTIHPAPALLANLMSLLSLLLSRRQNIKEGIDYLEQEILSALLSLLTRVTDPAEIVRAHIGIEVVIKVIRASNNPRTAQRALLVAGELARLVPEGVLHNVMPIFTFMGSSELQRDDAYSFGVVEKTVERIVPVMTRSLRAKATSKLELYKESKTFISIFTDMAARLPKHRTLPFFVHLVKSLGADDYLAPISMLLVDRSTSKAGRSGSSTAQAMDLSQGVAAAFDVDTRLEVVFEVVAEVSRLVDDASRDNKMAFLANPDVEQDRLLRQLTALLSFATTLAKNLVGKPTDQSTSEELVKSLLLLASSTAQSSVSGSGVPAAVQNCLATAMQLLSASKFLRVVSTLLQGDNEQDVIVALNILVERLPRVKPEVRATNAAIIGEILKKTAVLVKPTSRVNSAALSGLYAITSTAQKTEDGFLAGIVPGLVSVVSQLGEVVDQIATLSLLEIATRHLGSRVIPYIQSIIDTTLSLPPTSFSLVRQTFALQSALVEVVPSFIASKQLIALLKNALSGKEGSKDVVSTCSKKVPTKTLFPVIMDLWKSIQNETSSVLSAFFDLLRLVLRNADRASLPGLMKQIFAFFLDVFDLRHRLQLKSYDSDAIASVEDSAVGSFLELVTKLNEATFRPLFVRLYDWAVIDLSEGKGIDDARLTERRIVLFRVMMGLLNKFKNLLSPYIGTMLPHVEELLPAYANGEITDDSLLNLLLDVLAKSFDVDEGAYWTDAAYTKLVPSLVSLIDSPVTSSTSLTSGSTPAEHLAGCLGSLAGSTSTESVLKLVNTSICLASRSDTVSSRLAALKALEGIWTKQSEDLMPYVQETVGDFLGELVEDENGDVELLARRVVKTIEGVAGNVEEYLE